ncbi:MAG: hypothetical protein IIA67_09930, partial [Planctomycetes bacterium]|nr:hypothetical protein [Planctomycetota bacterium]
MRLLIASSTVLLLFVAVHFAQSATPGDPRAADLGPPAANWNVIEGIQPTAASQEWESHRARPVVSGPVRPNLPARPALDTPAFLPSQSPSFAAIDIPPQAQIAVP